MLGPALPSVGAVPAGRSFPPWGVRMSNTPAAGPGADIRSFGEKWWLLAVFGVVTLGFGVALTFQPGNSVHTIAVIIRIWLLILGVFRLIQAIGATGERIGLLIG